MEASYREHTLRFEVQVEWNPEPAMHHDVRVLVQGAPIEGAASAVPAGDLVLEGHQLRDPIELLGRAQSHLRARHAVDARPELASPGPDGVYPEC